MKIAFWSNARGKSCVTSNLACISVLSALSRPGERTIVFENHQNIINLGSTLFSHNSENVVKEADGYNVEKGLGRIMKSVERGETLPEDILYSSTKDFLGKRLFYIPTDEGKNPDVLEYQLDRSCIPTMKYLERYSDMVLVDTSSAPLGSSRKILQQADMVVVNLNQNRQMLSHFFRNYSSIRKKAFYLVGNYDAQSELSRGAIMKEYRIPGNRIGTIPHNPRFSDAVSDGMTIPFLLRNYSCESQNENFYFMAAARESAELFCSRLRAAEGKGGSTWEEGDGLF